MYLLLVRAVVEKVRCFSPFMGYIMWTERSFGTTNSLLGPNFNIVPGEDFMKYLTQDFDLMPPLSVAENVGKYLSNAYPQEETTTGKRAAGAGRNEGTGKGKSKEY